MESQSLLKIMVSAGLGSRRKIAQAIQEGRVEVNGNVVTAFNANIDIKEDRISFDGVQVNLETKQKVYLALNKPAGILSTTNDDRGRKTVMDFVPGNLTGMQMYPVGRLDRNSTGLILLTNDGDLAYHLSHPRFEHEKEYVVTLNQAVDESDLAQLRQGIELEDGMTSTARISVINNNRKYSYSVTIHEGKKHIVRRMFARLGYIVLDLERTRISCIELGNLKPGETRLLNEHEIARLTSC